MTPLERATEALVLAAEGLGRVLAAEAEGAGALADALERRAQAFEALRDAVRGPVPPEVRARLEYVVELDRGLQAQAEDRLAALRDQLGQVRKARLAARSLEAPARPPRFVSERA